MNCLPDGGAYGRTSQTLRWYGWQGAGHYDPCKKGGLPEIVDHSLYEILRVLDFNLFENKPIFQPLLGKLQDDPENGHEPIKQTLFPKLGR